MDSFVPKDKEAYAIGDEKAETLTGEGSQGYIAEQELVAARREDGVDASSPQDPGDQRREERKENERLTPPPPAQPPPRGSRGPKRRPHQRSLQGRAEPEPERRPAFPRPAACTGPATAGTRERPTSLGAHETPKPATSELPGHLGPRSRPREPPLGAI
ncbi:brain acid soluble protein 1-like [Canis lupus dingo]|uniref:brain acid soluble protein 1-like n=1 Tax=Canis lupus dingo TaxID=286419 RepID=UPI0020C38D90|nr:brain acid soluble protein 1-like [Canis lupus dingo]